MATEAPRDTFTALEAAHENEDILSALYMMAADLESDSQRSAFKIIIQYAERVNDSIVVSLQGSTRSN